MSIDKAQQLGAKVIKKTRNIRRILGEPKITLENGKINI
jgi:hypothetical protein